MLYSHNKKYPEPLPYRIRLSNGLTRTNPDTFTEEEILDAGYIAVSDPPEYFYPKKLIWDGESWNIIELSQEEIYSSWDSVRKTRNQLLQESDVVVIRDYENGTTVSKEWKDYRQSLRDITLQENPWSVIWPTKPE